MKMSSIEIICVVCLVTYGASFLIAIASVGAVQSFFISIGLVSLIGAFVFAAIGNANE